MLGHSRIVKILTLDTVPVYLPVMMGEHRLVGYRGDLDAFTGYPRKP